MNSIDGEMSFHQTITHAFIPILSLAQVVVTLKVNDAKILSAPFVSSAGSRVIAAVGVRLSIPNPKIPTQTAALQDTHLIFELKNEGGVEMVGFLDNQEDRYNVNVFECDSNNQRLPFVKPKTQTDRLRICIQPDDFTRNDAVKMYGVPDFTLSDGQNEQKVISKSSVQSMGDSDYGCASDKSLCFIETTVKNSFFATQQMERPL